ncbi:hypothetical protein G7Y89_g4326 [Cudoniella acicularis]|uniref:Calmodulin-lysine N-methyltransferase n=1 Tax=Cudoniella acicularis TaxID=354080 RepID=A0A8H4W7K0_9HELO|nr:hypothetical protein G7Y89_g4326 [Cudoniella acicularis]
MDNSGLESRDPDSDSEALDMFTEPADYYPPSPKPTTETHTLQSGLASRPYHLNLPRKQPLTHHLQNRPRTRRRAGLPSLVCSILCSKKVVVTDYPDPDLISNLWQNIDAAQINPIEKDDDEEKKIVAEGYCWGADPGPLLKHLPSTTAFDILILADLLFNHSEHAKLVATIEATLSKTAEAKALVFFTPYRPWLYEKDMAFFDLVKEKGFAVEKVLEEKMEKVMFEVDPGDEELRKTVFGYVVKWKL